MVYPGRPHQQRTGVAVFSGLPVDGVRRSYGTAGGCAHSSLRFPASVDSVSFGLPHGLLPLRLLPAAAPETALARVPEDYCLCGCHSVIVFLYHHHRRSDGELQALSGVSLCPFQLAVRAELYPSFHYHLVIPSPRGTSYKDHTLDGRGKNACGRGTRRSDY